MPKLSLHTISTHFIWSWLIAGIFLLGCTANGNTAIPVGETPTRVPTRTAGPTTPPIPTPEAPEPSIVSTLTILGIPQKLSVKVARVVDGDTILVEAEDGATDQVRLLGVDTPEISRANKPNEYGSITDTTCLDQWGVNAKKFTLDQLEGRNVTLMLDPGTGNGTTFGELFSFGRLLSFVEVDGQDFSAVLVSQGFARAYTDEPNSRQEEYLELQRKAQERNAGLWECEDKGAALGSTPTVKPPENPGGTSEPRSRRGGGSETTPHPTTELSPAASPQLTPTVTPIPTATRTLTPVPTAVPTSAPAPFPTGTPVSTPTMVPTTTPTATPAPAPTATPKATSTLAPTATPIPVPTSVPTATLTPTATPVSPSPSGAVLIECIFFDGLIPRSEADEYVQIANSGSISVDLSGWRLVDTSDGTPEFTFPFYNLDPGASIRVYTDEVHAEWGGFSFNRGTPIWANADPDVASLFDSQGQLVSTRTYPPGC